MAFGFGGGSSKSETRQDSSSLGINYGYQGSGSYLDPYQQAAQQQLIGQFMGNMGAGLGGGFQQNRHTNVGLRENAWQAAQAGRQMGALGQFGMNQLQQFSQMNNPYINQQIGGLAQDAGRLFSEQILPGIGSGFQAAGQRGSSRQGIAEGLAAQGVQDSFAREAGNLRANAYGMQQQAAGQLSQLGQQGLFGGYQAMGNLAGQLGQNAALYQQMQMNPFIIGSQVIGAPTVLQSSFGEDFGFNQSQSRSRSKGSSSNANFGF